MELDEQIMLGIVRVSERFKKEASALFATVELTFSQYNVLRILDAAPGDQLTMSEVSSRILVSGANMTGVAKRLEKKGLIRRRASESDERVKYLQLRESGRQTLRRIEQIEKTHVSNFLSTFSSDEKQMLFRSVVDILKSRALDID